MKENIKKQVHEIIELVMEGNGLEARLREETGTKPTFFFTYSGHVNSMTVEIYKTGWDGDADRDSMWQFKLDDEIPEVRMEALRNDIHDAVSRIRIEELEKEIYQMDRDIHARIDSLTKMRTELSELKNHG